MTANTDPLLGQLHTLVAELEGLAKHAASAAENGGSDVAEHFKGALTGARERLQDLEHSLERDLKKHTRTVDRYVHDNAWVSIGVAAAVAFLLGALARRRD